MEWVGIVLGVVVGLLMLVVLGAWCAMRKDEYTRSVAVSLTVVLTMVVGIYLGIRLHKAQIKTTPAVQKEAPE